MAKGRPNIALGYSTNTIKPAGKPIGSGNAGQDLVNKIRSGAGGAWGGGKW
jgi:hypothetical protein